MSSSTSSRSTLTMTPSTMSPSLKYLIVWSMAARKSSAVPMSLTAAWGGLLGRTLGDVDFLWCPEGLRESEAHLLGDVAGRRVLEVGCGSAPCARWLRREGADVVALDLSGGMLT